ncbi:MAG: OmpH family outer membrane protein [Saprospiraceae bacterium]|nr:OmpH family outer membrane protein [Saprospiraceae bacterium]
MNCIHRMSCIAMMLLPLILPAQKVGHFHYPNLIDSLQEAREATVTLRQYEKALTASGDTMVMRFQEKLKTYQGEMKRGNLTGRQQKEMEAELEVEQNAIVNYRESVRQSLDKKRNELKLPILQKIERVIRELAKEEGYAFVFDSSAGLLYFRDSEDIFSKVFRKLQP